MEKYLGDFILNPPANIKNLKMMNKKFCLRVPCGGFRKFLLTPAGQEN